MLPKMLVLIKGKKRDKTGTNGSRTKGLLPIWQLLKLNILKAHLLKTCFVFFSTNVPYLVLLFCCLDYRCVSGDIILIRCPIFTDTGKERQGWKQEFSRGSVFSFSSLCSGSSPTCCCIDCRSQKYFKMNFCSSTQNMNTIWSVLHIG